MRPFDEAEAQRIAWCKENGVEHLRDWYGRYAGQDVVICALGHSLRDLEGRQDLWTMGINDVVRIRALPGWADWQPDFLCLLDRVLGMQEERRSAIHAVPPKVATFQCNANVKDRLPSHPLVVDWERTGGPIRDMVAMKAAGKIDWWTPKGEHVSHCHTTTICAAGIAWRLGFMHIGILGMDYTAGYAWDPEGSRTHQLWDYRNDIAQGFRILAEQAEEDGCEIVNLSTRSPCWWGKSMSLDQMRPKW